MGKIKDLSGQKFGRLQVLNVVGVNKFQQALWNCKCDCGNTTVTVGRQLINSDTRSCGCLAKEHSARQGKKNITHGMSHSPEYRAWDAMKKRCFNPKYQWYENYGGRGITVFPGWIHNFKAFFEHVGFRPSNQHSLDRIKVNENYEPGNVKWSTPKEQADNRRNRQVLTKFSMEELIEELEKRQNEQPKTRSNR
jgi:hypothetical protein